MAGNATNLSYTPEENITIGYNVSDIGNFSKPPRQLLLADHVFEGTWLSLIILIGVWGNLFVLYFNIFTKKRQRLGPTEVFILNSAIADTCSCVTSVPGQLYGTLLNAWQLGDVACVTKFLISSHFVCVSINSNFAISIFCLITCILRPGSRLQLKHAVYIAIIIWFYVGAFLYYPYFASGINIKFDNQVLFYCWFGFDMQYLRYLLMSILPPGYLPAICLAVVYAVIVFKMSKGDTWKHSDQSRRLVKCTIGIIALFFGCFFPSFCFMFLDHSSFNDWQARVMRYTQYAMLSNAALNPLYYIFRMDDMVHPTVAKYLKKAKVGPQDEDREKPQVCGPSIYENGEILLNLNTIGECTCTDSYTHGGSHSQTTSHM